MAQKPIGTLPEQVKVARRYAAPIDHQREAEMAAGRARVQHHEDRERMIAAKRQRDDEGTDVANAKAANKNL